MRNIVAVEGMSFESIGREVDKKQACEISAPGAGVEVMSSELATILNAAANQGNQ